MEKEGNSTMPLDKKRHEEILAELNNPELEHAKRTDLLSELRQDYVTVHEDFNNLNQNLETLKKDNDDLVSANSKLFRQAGVYDNEDLKDDLEKKTFSEEISIEALEKRI